MALLLISAFALTICLALFSWGKALGEWRSHAQWSATPLDDFLILFSIVVLLSFRILITVRRWLQYWREQWRSGYSWHDLAGQPFNLVLAWFARRRDGVPSPYVKNPSRSVRWRLIKLNLISRCLNDVCSLFELRLTLCVFLHHVAQHRREELFVARWRPIFHRWLVVNAFVMTVDVCFKALRRRLSWILKSVFSLGRRLGGLGGREPALGWHRGAFGFLGLDCARSVGGVCLLFIVLWKTLGVENWVFIVRQFFLGDQNVIWFTDGSVSHIVLGELILDWVCVMGTATLSKQLSCDQTSIFLFYNDVVTWLLSGAIQRELRLHLVNDPSARLIRFNQLALPYIWKLLVDLSDHLLLALKALRLGRDVYSLYPFWSFGLQPVIMLRQRKLGRYVCLFVQLVSAITEAIGQELLVGTTAFLRDKLKPVLSFDAVCCWLNSFVGFASNLNVDRPVRREHTRDQGSLSLFERWLNHDDFIHLRDFYKRVNWV